MAHQPLPSMPGIAKSTSESTAFIIFIRESEAMSITEKPFRYNRESNVISGQRYAISKNPGVPKFSVIDKNAEILTITGICLAALFALSFAVEYYFYRKQNNPGECKNILPYLIYSVLFLLLWIEPTGYGVFALSMAAFLYICRDIFLDIFSGLKQQRQEKKSTD